MAAGDVLVRTIGRARSETGGLDFEIQVKEGARIMLTTNIYIKDRLIWERKKHHLRDVVRFVFSGQCKRLPRRLVII